MKRVGANKISRSFQNWCARKNAEYGTRIAERWAGFTRPIDRDRAFCSAVRLVKRWIAERGTSFAVWAWHDDRRVRRLRRPGTFQRSPDNRRERSVPAG